MKLAAQVMLFQRLWDWFTPRDIAERYLAEATDLADLERRLRALERERARVWPAFLTFNH